MTPPKDPLRIRCGRFLDRFGQLCLRAAWPPISAAEQLGQGARQLDFVYFLDAREREGVAVVAGEEAFRASHARFKWDVLQR